MAESRASPQNPRTAMVAAARPAGAYFAAACAHPPPRVPAATSLAGGMASPTGEGGADALLRCRKCAGITARPLLPSSSPNSSATSGCLYQASQGNDDLPDANQTPE